MSLLGGIWPCGFMAQIHTAAIYPAMSRRVDNANSQKEQFHIKEWC